jgi:outer membrane cobalamin receptor
MKRPYSAAAAAFALVAPLAHAEPDQLEQVIVTGTRIEEVRDQMPSPTTVIDQAQIELQNPVSAVDLLRSVPGLQIVQPGGGAGIVSVYLHGCQPNYVLFLVDGVKVNDSNDSRGGSFDVSTLAPGELQRVEIIRGPESAVYGADAMCGVVNFITRGRTDTWDRSLEATAGLGESYGSAVSVEGPWLERGGLALRAATTDQGNTVPGATFGANNFNGKLVLDRGTGYDLTLHARYVTTHGSDYPAESGGPDFAVSPARDQRETRQTDFDLAGRVEVSSALTLNALASTYHHAVDYATPSVITGFDDTGAPIVAVPGRGEISDLARNYGALHATLDLPFGIKSILGGDFQHEQGQVNGYIAVAPGFNFPDSFVLDRHISGAFAEIEYTAIPGVTLSGSLRHDAPSDTEAHTTAKAGAVYSPDGGITELRLEWGQGFKEPSLWALGNALVGNPDLKSEQSRTSEFGVSRYLDDRRARIELTVYQNHFVDLVDFDNNLFQFVNRPLVTGEGAELALHYALTDAVSIDTHTSYSDVNMQESGIQLLQRPKWRGGAQVAWRPTAAWSFFANGLATGRAEDFSIPPGGYVALGSYTVFNLNAEWQATPNLALKLGVDNVFDRRYYEAYGFAVAGFEPRLTVGYHF